MSLSKPCIPKARFLACISHPSHSFQRRTFSITSTCPTTTSPPSTHSPTAPRTILSGIQPTGVPHLGNYLGALANWVKLQHELLADVTIYYSIVDLHALTMPQDPAELRRAKLDMAISLLACGVDPKRSVLFEQSRVPQHAELAWVLNCITPVGWLSRMTQWKSKLSQNKPGTPSTHAQSIQDSDLTSGLRMGLFAYPILQAADILIYKYTFTSIFYA
ncbi:30S ribosomal protein S10 [Jimgerdemannia flammicorona]|uniref:tryptophan--tRNA ligase n=1 Tax=Jimgerdemannia flammicorona TaxID=994334 RepID=A0A433D1T9_9FUNG|nr:30S ribosomal protein S10 [Jimgerdemannia flammicorona]